MIREFYLMILIFSIIFTVIVLINNKMMNSRYMAFCFLVICNSYGRYLISTARSMDSAMIGQKILYAGSCFCPLIMLFSLAQLSNLKFSKIVNTLTSIFAFVIFFFVMNIDRNQWYYRSIRLIRKSGYTYLVKDYGPAHSLYYVYLLLCVVLMAFYVIYAVVKKEKVSGKTVNLVCCIGLVTIICYVIDNVCRFPVSMVSVSYLCIIILMIWLNDHITVYDVSTNIAESVEKTKSMGYIEFDKKNRFMGNNRFAAELFPEIGECWDVDSPVPETDSFLYREVVSWAKEPGRKEEDKKTVFLKDRYYELSIRNIMRRGRRKKGYILEIADRTAENLYMEKIENYNEDLISEVEQKTQRISYIKDMMVLGMASMVESRDNSTGGHIRRTSVGMRVFCEHLTRYKDQLNRDSSFFKTIVKVAPMHDLGKIAVDDRILRKNGKFTDEEYSEMKKHSMEGAKIVNTILRGVEEDEIVDIAENVAHYHHEKWDGSGYPEGLSGVQIPLEARIMALVDVFDALVSRRCYKEAFSYDTAFRIIEESSGSHFDPELSQLFLECRNDLEEAYNRMNLAN